MRRPRSGDRRALVLVVNRRPRGSLAPDRLRLRLLVTAARGLGTPDIRQVADAFTRPLGGRTPSLCGLTRGGSALDAGALRGVLERGRPLPGFGAAAATAEAYDVACRLPYDQAFARAVRATCAAGLAAGCCPQNALCAAPPPSPAPAPTPTPTPPCPPCPRPACGTFVCPLGMRGALRVIVCPLPLSPALAC